MMVGLVTSLPLIVINPLATLAIATPIAEIAQVTSRPTLRLSSSGSFVLELQALLTLLGYYNSPIDGNYQTGTEAAVRTFQQDAGLNSDGVVGPETWAKLLPAPSTEFTPPDVLVGDSGAAGNSGQRNNTNKPAELPVLRVGIHGSAVSRVQEALKRLGFYQGPVDGVFGPMTEDAVIAFQRDTGLSADGVVGTATWRALLQ